MDTRYKKRYRIPSSRLPTYDYTSNGYYFITICTKNRENYFGEIVDNKMQLFKIGRIAKKFWQEIPQHFPFVTLDEFGIMPNHLHGIVVINGDKITPVETPKLGVSTKLTLVVIINQFKRACTMFARINNVIFYF